RSLVMATLSSRPFIASSRQKTSRAWRRKAGIERPTRSSCKTRCKEQPQSKGSCARALLPHAKVELGPACGGARGAQQKSPERRIARARWRSFGEYAFLEDSRYASQLKMCDGANYPPCRRRARSRTKVNRAGALLQAA